MALQLRIEGEKNAQSESNPRKPKNEIIKPQKTEAKPRSRFLKVDDLASKLHCSRSKAYEIAKGLRTVKIGGLLRIPAEELDPLANGNGNGKQKRVAITVSVNLDSFRKIAMELFPHISINRVEIQ